MKTIIGHDCCKRNPGLHPARRFPHAAIVFGTVTGVKAKPSGLAALGLDSGNSPELQAAKRKTAES